MAVDSMHQLLNPQRHSDQNPAWQRGLVNSYVCCCAGDFELVQLEAVQAQLLSSQCPQAVIL